MGYQIVTSWWFSKEWWMWPNINLLSFEAWGVGANKWLLMGGVLQISIIDDIINIWSLILYYYHNTRHQRSEFSWSTVNVFPGQLFTVWAWVIISLMRSVIIRIINYQKKDKKNKKNFLAASCSLSAALEHPTTIL